MVWSYSFTLFISALSSPLLSPSPHLFSLLSPPFLSSSQVAERAEGKEHNIHACCFIADSYKANIIVVENDDHLQKILQVRHTLHTTITSYNHTWGILYVHVLCPHLLCVCVCVDVGVWLFCAAFKSFFAKKM